MGVCLFSLSRAKGAKFFRVFGLLGQTVGAWYYFRFDI